MCGVLFGYIGPETYLPLTSAATAVLGGLLVFGRRLFHPLANWFRIAVGRPRAVERVEPPTWRGDAS